MADATDKFAIRILPNVGGQAGGGINWTPIVVPIDCSRVVLRNTDATNAVLLQTDPNDPTTQDSIPASSEYTIQITAMTTYLKALTILCFFHPAAGNNGLTMKCYR